MLFTMFLTPLFPFSRSEGRLQKFVIKKQKVERNETACPRIEKNEE